MRKIILLAVVLMTSLNAHSSQYERQDGFNWKNAVPFKFEMSWKLSEKLKKEVFLLSDTKEECNIGAIGAQEYGEICYEVSENTYRCSKQANGIQGENDYKCSANLSVLINRVKVYMFVKFYIYDGERQMIQLNSYSYN